MPTRAFVGRMALWPFRATTRKWNSLAYTYDPNRAPRRAAGRGGDWRRAASFKLICNDSPSGAPFRRDRAGATARGRAQPSPCKSMPIGQVVALSRQGGAPHLFSLQPTPIPDPRRVVSGVQTARARSTGIFVTDGRDRCLDGAIARRVRSRQAPGALTIAFQERLVETGALGAAVRAAQFRLLSIAKAQGGVLALGWRCRCDEDLA